MATGERSRQRRLSCAAAKTSTRKDWAAITRTVRGRIRPRARGREAVRGFLASSSICARRLTEMAPVLAQTIATRIHAIVPPSEIPCPARTAPVNAKGRPKTVCGNLMSSRKRRNCCNRPTDRGTLSTRARLLSLVDAHDPEGEGTDGDRRKARLLHQDPQPVGRQEAIHGGRKVCVARPLPRHH